MIYISSCDDSVFQDLLVGCGGLLAIVISNHISSDANVLSSILSLGNQAVNSAAHESCSSVY